MPRKSINAKQINALLTELRAAYAGVRLKAEDEDALPRVWLEALHDQDHDAVKRAVAQHIRASRYWPSPAEILALVAEGAPDIAHDDDPPLVRAAIAEGVGAIQARHWFGPGSGVEIRDQPVRDGVVVLGCDSKFRADWIAANFPVEAIVSRALGRPVRVATVSPTFGVVRVNAA